MNPATRMLKQNRHYKSQTISLARLIRKNKRVGRIVGGTFCDIKRSSLMFILCIPPDQIA
jgi:hypothetical protein